MIKIRYERQKLYEQIWKEPMTKVAERYNVSSSALCRTCKKLNIPLPGPGYWNKVYAGQKMSVKELPPSKGPGFIEYEIWQERPPRKSKSSEGVLSFLNNEKKKEIEDFCAGIFVPIELDNPHHIIQKTINDELYRKEIKKPPKTDILLFDVSKEKRQSIFLFVDTIFKSIEKLGYATKCTNHYPCIYQGSDYVYFEIREMRTKVPHISTDEELKRVQSNPYPQ